jgi:DNA-directed RNA polymerase specialized sigma24 family protein
LVLSDQVRVDSFTGFVADVGPRLRGALTASFGSEVGRDATAEALSYAWRHWDRVGGMDNAAGYLFRVGTNFAKKAKPVAIAADFESVSDRVPWVEPGLGPALAALPTQQRTVIALVHGFEWTLGEVAEMLGRSKSTVQTHEQRGMKTLRRKMGVEQ